MSLEPQPRAQHLNLGIMLALRPTRLPILDDHAHAQLVRLPLRWYEESGDELVELRDICDLNLRRDEGPMALTELPTEHCFTLGTVERRLRELAEHAEAAERIPLRSLFRRARG